MSRRNSVLCVYSGLPQFLKVSGFNFSTCQNEFIESSAPDAMPIFHCVQGRYRGRRLEFVKCAAPNHYLVGKKWLQISRQSQSQYGTHDMVLALPREQALPIQFRTSNLISSNHTLSTTCSLCNLSVTSGSYLIDHLPA